MFNQIGLNHFHDRHRVLCGLDENYASWDTQFHTQPPAYDETDLSYPPMMPPSNPNTSWAETARFGDIDLVAGQPSSVATNFNGRVVAFANPYASNPETNEGRFAIYETTDYQTYTEVYSSESNAYYGYYYWGGHNCVAVSADGLTVAVGSPDYNSRGRVWIIRKIAGVWQLWNTSDGLTSAQEHGFSVALSWDGAQMLIGSTGQSSGGTSTGRVRMYTRGDSSYAYNNFFESADAKVSNDRLGITLSTTATGEWTVAGESASLEATLARYSSGSFPTKLTLNDSYTQYARVAISGDGSRVYVASGTQLDIWNTSGTKIANNIATLPYNVEAISTNYDGSRVMLHDYYATRIYSVNSSNVATALDTSQITAGYSSVAMSGNGRMAYTAVYGAAGEIGSATQLIRAHRLE